MKTFITLIILSFSTISFGQKTINLNFLIVSNGSAMSKTEIKFYSSSADTLLHTATSDENGYISWKNAPKIDMEAVFFDSTYIYEPNTEVLFKKTMTDLVREIELQKLSKQEYKTLMTAMEKSTSDSILEVINENGTVAEFTGGRDALVKFLQKNIRIPASAEESGLDGKVYVRFIVEADGSIKSLSVKKSLTVDTDYETIRVISLMPKWIPATVDGIAVPMYYTLPIVYKVR